MSGFLVCLGAVCLAACGAPEQHIEHLETYGLCPPPPPELTPTSAEAFAALTGIGATRDDARARALLEQACANHDAFACEHVPPPTYDLPNSSVPKKVVDGVIAESRGKIQVCRDDAMLGAPVTPGVVEVAFAFDQHGHVLTYKTTKTVLNAAATTCIEQVVRRLVFPSSTAPRLVQVIYQFPFKAR